jgi:hypothetical protein
MILTPRRLILAAAALFAAGCTATASGQIPCADDSSCPKDFPVCNGAALGKPGKCTSGTVTSTGAIAIVGVDGHATTDEVRGTVRVNVTARASSGVSTVALTAGTKSYPTPTVFSPPLYSFDILTTDLSNGDVVLTATLTAGDNTTLTSTPYTLHVDNATPVLSAATLAATDVPQGGTVALDVTANEPLSSISGTATSGTTTITLGETSKNGNVHHLVGTLPATAPAGVWTILLSATDLPGNCVGPTPCAAPSVAGPSFNVRAPISITSVVLDKSAVTTGGTVNISITLSAGATLSTKPTVSVGLAGTAGTALGNVSGSGTSFTASYSVAPADVDGQYNVSVTATDVAGNVATPVVKSFAIKKTPPALSIVLGSSLAGPNSQITFTVAVSAAPATFTAKVNGHAATCTGTATTLASCSYTPSLTADFATASLIPAAPVSVTVTDALGNPNTAGKTVVLDAQAPTLSVTTDLSPINAKAGILLTMNVLPSKALSAFNATVATGGTTAGAMSDIAQPDADGTRHLGFAVTPSLAPGVYTISITATDLALNVTAAATTRTFTVYGAFAISSMVLTGAATENGYPAVTNLTGKATINASLTLPSGVVVSGNPVVTVTTFTGQTRSTTANCTSTTCTASYVVDSVAVDGEGVASFAVTVTDVAGNTASITKAFLIDKTAPVFFNGSSSSVVGPVTGHTTVNWTFTVNKSVAIGPSFTITVPNATTGNVHPGQTNCTPSGLNYSCSYTLSTSDKSYVGSGAIAIALEPANSTDVVGNQPAPFSISGAIYDGILPAATGSITATNLSFPAFSGTAANAVKAKNGQQIQFVGSVTTGASLSLASATISSDNGTSAGCVVSGTSYTCVLAAVSSSPCATAACAGLTATITATDTLGNVSGNITTPGFTIDNVLPTVGAITATNLSFPSLFTGTTDNAVSVKNGQQVSFSGNAATGASLNLASAAVSSAGNGTSGGCSVSTTTFTCVLNVSNSGCAVTPCTTPTATLTLTDALGNVSAGIPTPKFTISNVLPLVAQPALSAVTVKGGGSIQFVSSVTLASGRSIGSAGVALATGGSATGSGSCSITGAAQVTCSWTVSSPTSANSTSAGNVVTITVNDDVGNSGNVTTAGGTAYSVDNTIPSVPQPTLSATTVRGGATITFTVNGITLGSGRNIASASIAKTGTGSSTGSGACSFSGASVTCTWTVATPMAGTSANNQVTITVNDDLGNTGSVQTTGATTYTVDNTVGALPQPTLSTATVKAGSSITFTITGISLGVGRSIASATIVKATGGSATGSGSCLFSGTTATCTWTVATPSSANSTSIANVVTITVNDDIGNTQSVTTSGGAGTTYTVDNTLPGVPQPALSKTAVKGGGTITFTSSSITLGTSRSIASASIVKATGGSANGSGSCSVSGAAQVTCLWTVSSPTSANSTSAGNVVTITVNDDIGNSGAVTTTGGTAYSVDNTVPGVPQPSLSATTIKGGGTITFTSSSITLGTSRSIVSASIVKATGGSANGSGSCSVSGAAQVTCLWTVSSPTSANSTSAGNVVTITVNDDIGNSGAVTTTGGTAYSVDNVAPSFTVNAAPANATLNKTVVVSGTSNKTLASANYSVQVGGSTTLTGGCALDTPKTGVTCSITVPGSGTSDGIKTVTVTATDQFGNAGTPSTTFNIDTNPPTLTTSPSTSVVGGTAALSGGQAQVGSVVQIQFTVQDTGGLSDSGVDNTAVPTVTVAGLPATKTAQVGSQYTYQYSVSGAETGAASGSLPVSVSGFADLAGNTGTNTAGTVACDLIPPALNNVTTYQRTPGSSGSVQVDVTLVAANGSTRVCAFDSSSHAAAAISCSSPGGLSGLGTTVATTTPGVSVTVSNTSLLGGVFLRDFDAAGLPSAVKASPVKSVSLPTTLAATTKTYDVKTPAVAPATVVPTQLTNSFTFSGSATSTVGRWSATTSTTNAPTARTRPIAAFDSVNRKFIVSGGVETTGLSTDRSLYIFDPVTGSWGTPVVNALPAPAGGLSVQFDAAAAFDPPQKLVVAHGGRQAKSATNSNLNGYLTFNVSTSTVWASVTTSNTNNSASGAEGMLAYDNFLGGLSGFSNNDGAGGATQFDLLSGITNAIYTAITPATIPSVRFGAAAAPDPTLLANSFAMFGGFVTPAASFAATNTVANTTNTYFWNGSDFTVVNPGTKPTARAYAGFTSTTSTSQYLMLAGLTADCTTTTGGTVIPAVGTGNCTTGTGATVDDLWVLDATGPTWTQVATNSTSAGAGLGIGPGEVGSSFHAFADDTGGSLWAYRPANQTLQSLPLARAPHLVFAFDSSTEGVTSSNATDLSLPLTVTATSRTTGQSIAVSATIAIFLWNFNTGAWVDNTSNFTANTLHVATNLNVAPYVSAGKTFVLMGIASNAATFEYKQVSLTAAGPLTWQVNTP